MTTKSHIYLAHCIPWSGSMPHRIIKIGKADNLAQRQQQLSRTHIPYDVQFVKAWEVPKARVFSIENQLHTFFAADRLINKGRTSEWFSDRRGIIEKQIDTMMHLLGPFQTINFQQQPIVPQQAKVVQSTGMTPTQQSYHDFWTKVFDVQAFPPEIEPRSTSSLCTLGKNYRQVSYNGHSWSYTMSTGSANQSRVGIFHQDKTKSALMKLDARKHTLLPQLQKLFPNDNVIWRLSNSPNKACEIRVDFDNSGMCDQTLAKTLLDKMKTFAPIIIAEGV